MKLVVDVNLPPKWVEFLATRGIEAVHWSQVGDLRATDSTIMQWARDGGLRRAHLRPRLLRPAGDKRRRRAKRTPGPRSGRLSRIARSAGRASAARAERCPGERRDHH